MTGLALHAITRVQPPPQELPEREDDLASLARNLGAAAEGRGSMLLFEGPVGIGKSTLSAWSQSAAKEAGMEVGAARASTSERNFPFGVVLQLLEPTLGRAGPQARKRILSGAGHQAAPLFGGDAPATPLAGEPELRSLLHGLYWTCANLSERAPLLLCIDDAHWMDDTSLRFVHYLAQRIESLPLMVLLTSIPIDQPRQPPLLRDIASHPAVTRIRLRPLSEDAATAWLRDFALPNADDEMLRACYAVTGGNPLLLRELSMALEHERPGQEVTPAAVRESFVPRPITTWVTRAMYEVDPQALPFAAAVAILGDEVELRHVAALGGFPTNEAVRLADALAQADFMRRDDRLSFVHAIVRNAVYRSVPPCERADKHLMAARTLAAEGEEAERVAGHLLEAPRAGSGWTVDVLMDASVEELSRGAPELAVPWLRRALEEPPPKTKRAAATLALGRAEAAAGVAHAATHLRGALELVREPSERALIAFEVGCALAVRGDHRRGAEALKRGLEEIPDGDPALRARLLSALTMVARSGLSPDDMPREVSRLRKGGSGSGPSQISALAARQALEEAFACGDRARVRAAAEQALGGGAFLDEETADGLGFYVVVAALSFAEELQTAELAAAMAMDEARGRGSVLGLATAACFRGLTVMQRGRVQDAAADADIVLGSRAHGWGLAVPMARALMITALVESGDLTGAERQLRTADMDNADWVTMPSAAYLGARAQLRLAQGRLEESLADHLECGRRLTRMGITNPAVTPWLSGAAVAHAQLGNSSDGIAMAEQELRRAESYGAPGPIGHALRALAAVESGDRRIELLEQALAVLTDSQAVLERAHALVAFGAALRRTGRRRDARDPLLKGLEIAGRCGANRLVSRAVSETTAAGARPRRAALEGVGSLTPREREVVNLAASGMTNREIAEALYVTLKTVEWHLKHSYRKLGVTRAGLAGALEGHEPAAEG